MHVCTYLCKSIYVWMDACMHVCPRIYLRLYLKEFQYILPKYREPTMLHVCYVMLVRPMATADRVGDHSSFLLYFSFFFPRD